MVLEVGEASLSVTADQGMADVRASDGAHRHMQGWHHLKQAVLTLGLSLISVLASAGVMSTDGKLGVAESGAGTYSVAIQTPPGIAGVQPQLGFTYNSQTGNGLLGVGWSLSGLSAITRCPRTIAQDGVRGGVNFDSNDRYCLDGQRLIAINGSDGVSGTEYRTELDRFSRIISYGSAGNGPAWFRVWTKSGQILDYGNSADSQIAATQAAANTVAWPAGSVRVWALNKLSDTKGNFFTLTYTNDPANGDYYPSRIDYTGNGSQAPGNSVRLVYETRPDIVPQYFAGARINSTQRLSKVQTYQGATPSKEYRLTYTTGATSGRSRLASLTECALPSALCKSALTFTLSEANSNTYPASSNWSSTLGASFVTDVNGDGKSDFVGIGSDGLYVSLSTGSGAGTMSRWVSAFGTNSGYGDQTLYPVTLTDVNGDGLPDAVGFASDGVYVALNTGSAFNAPTKWIADFGTVTAFAWTNVDTYPRTLADVNGDGLPDIVGFRNDGVYVALNTGSGFSAATQWINDFGTSTAIAYSTNTANPRMVGDLNGDGKADLIGFSANGVYVALSTGSGFTASSPWNTDFGTGTGWTDETTYPRMLGDINGDGLPDLIGFKNDGVYVSINTGASFTPSSRWLNDFGTSTTTAYSTQSAYPRYATDLNGDGLADIVGFSANGVQVSLSTGTALNPSTQWVAGFGSGAGYTSSTMRQFGDVDGDGFPDIIGSNSGTNVSLSGRTIVADLVTQIQSGLGTSASFTYYPLTSPSVYTRGSGAVYPQMDMAPAMYVVGLARSPNGIGNGYTTTYYQYGQLRGDAQGRGLLGFGWAQVTQADTGIGTRVTYRQDWPYVGLPTERQKILSGAGSNGLLSLITNTYGCLNPQTGAACTIVAGNRYFPYVSQTTDAEWDVNGTALPITTTVSQYDTYGNPTQINVTAQDGFVKTTTNTYTNDTTNWYLGRLTQSQVQSTATGTPVSGMSNGEFVFNQTISANTNNYNLKAAAIAAGWDQIRPLSATVTINSGIVVSSTSTATPAFDTGSGFPTGTQLALINNGTIIGMGGAGGNGASSTVLVANGLPGAQGGNGMLAQATLSVTNNGTIAGGGGGGSGGGNAKLGNVDNGYRYPGGGGGGGGAPFGLGGSGGTGLYPNGVVATSISGANGGTATLTIAGAGGAGGSGAAGSGTNGGSAGTQGAGIQGGKAGAAITGSAYVKWLVQGTVLGAQQL